MGLKVIVVGCGIAGPFLAILLKLKGFEPVVYERGERTADVGISLMLQLNGLRVLSLVPGLVEKISGMVINEALVYSIVPSDERLLGQSDYPTKLREKYGHGLLGVRRREFATLLAETAMSQGIPFHFEQQVVDVEQTDNAVLVRLNTGETDTASFVIGCDGLHSTVRTVLFGKEEPEYTGLVQIAGFTPAAKVFEGQKSTFFNFYGEDCHIVAYPISDLGYSWALSRREPEDKEGWRAMDDAAKATVMNGPFSKMPFDAGALLRNAEKIIKYGLYDRPDLSLWHKGRVLLIGDAAHPTSPHLGQGANQAFEDAYHLARLLSNANSKPFEAEGLPTTVLTDVFTEFEAKRKQRTAGMVRGARAMGEMRVVRGLEHARERNDRLFTEWGDQNKLQTKSETLLDDGWEGFD
ncbi:hypothetical protein C8J57DRAFT_1303076 [Mycena rebaudengoi]|nr:hypothetical protein C8J57DRAFT_1303076 [Mycena rebaudengoi]